MAVVDFALAALATRGWDVIENAVSRRLRVLLLAESHGTDLRLVREAYEGFPLRISERVLGTPVLSSAARSVPEGWHTGIRTDRGAPPGFVPALTVCIPLDDPVPALRVIPGSFRGVRCAEELEAIAQVVPLRCDDLVILDSRLARCWDGAVETVYSYTVVRPWIVPAMPIPAMAPAGAPGRAARFYGLDAAPETDIGEWIVQRHPRRP